jgi:Fic family protein
MLGEPILYLSLFLKRNRKMYYDLLQEVRLQGTWETWLEFFLEGVYQSAKQATQTAVDINNMFKQDHTKISSLGRARFSCEQTFDYLKMLPQVTVPLLANELGMTAPTARSSLNLLVRIGVIEEMSGKKRDKVYVYRRYLNILEEGADPFD